MLSLASVADASLPGPCEPVLAPAPFREPGTRP